MKQSEKTDPVARTRSWIPGYVFFTTLASTIKSAKTAVRSLTSSAVHVPLHFGSMQNLQFAPPFCDIYAVFLRTVGNFCTQFSIYLRIRTLINYLIVIISYTN